MKKKGFCILMVLLVTTTVWGQKKLTEGTIYYDIVINTVNNTPSKVDMLDGSTNVVSIKGTSSRSDMISSLGTQSTIINGKTGDVTILKDFGEQKFITSLTANDWKNINKKYDSVTYTLQNEFKTIASYNCQKAIGKFSDNTTFTVYFTKEILVANTDFQHINKNLPGFAMEYEASTGKNTLTFTVSNIDFGTVPMSKFDIPSTGYRVLPFQDPNKK